MSAAKQTQQKPQSDLWVAFKVYTHRRGPLSVWIFDIHKVYWEHTGTLTSFLFFFSPQVTGINEQNGIVGRQDKNNPFDYLACIVKKGEKAFVADCQFRLKGKLLILDSSILADAGQKLFTHKAKALSLLRLHLHPIRMKS